MFFSILCLLNLDKERERIVKILISNPKRIRVIFLTFVVLIPNRIFINSLAWWLTSLVIIYFYLVGYTYSFFHFIVMIHLYLCFISIIFGYMYSKLDSFRFHFSSFFFKDREECHEVITYFYGNTYFWRIASVGLYCPRQLKAQEVVIGHYQANETYRKIEEAAKSQPNSHLLKPEGEQVKLDRLLELQEHFTTRIHKMILIASDSIEKVSDIISGC